MTNIEVPSRAHGLKPGWAGRNPFTPKYTYPVCDLTRHVALSITPPVAALQHSFARHVKMVLVPISGWRGSCVEGGGGPWFIPRPALEPQVQVQLLPPTSHCCNGSNATSGGGRTEPGTRSKVARLTLTLARLLCCGFWASVLACWIVLWW